MHSALDTSHRRSSGGTGRISRTESFRAVDESERSYRRQGDMTLNVVLSALGDYSAVIGALTAGETGYAVSSRSTH